IYSMKSRLINVRLDADRLRKARKLRENGVVLSDLVREAIDSKFEALRTPDQPRRATRLLDELFTRYPDPPGLPPRAVDPRDRRAVQAVIRRKLSRPAR